MLKTPCHRTWPAFPMPPLFTLWLTTWLLLAIYCCCCCDCGHVLMWMDYGSRSHFATWRPLAAELAKRGHRVTVVAPMADPDLASTPNVHFVSVNVDLAEMVNSADIFEGQTHFDLQKAVDKNAKTLEAVLSNPEVRSLLSTLSHVDVAVVYPFSTSIGIYVAKEFPTLDLAMGNPVNPAYVPMPLAVTSSRMDLAARVFNTVMTVAAVAVTDYYLLPKETARLCSLLGLRLAPDVTAMRHEADLLLVNAHPMLDSARPVNHNTAFVAGIHCRPASPDLIPSDVAAWLDEAPQGVVLVAFGSILSSSEMASEKLGIFVRALGGLKQRVLWKWETEHMPGKPDNVLLKKWLPQQDILGHPNVRLFVSHAGLLSVQEALYHEVPMVLLPAFADQFFNAQMAVDLGIATQLSWTGLTEEALRSALITAVSSSSMRSASAAKGALFRDDVSSPLDRAAFHIEHVMKHGAEHLRPRSKDLSWPQYLLLDVLLVLALAVVFVVLIFCVLIWIIYAVTIKLCVRITQIGKDKQE